MPGGVTVSCGPTLTNSIDPLLAAGLDEASLKPNVIVTVTSTGYGLSVRLIDGCDGSVPGWMATVADALGKSTCWFTVAVVSE